MYPEMRLTYDSELSNAFGSSSLGAYPQIPKALFQKVKSTLVETGSFWIIWPFQAKVEILTEAAKHGLFVQNCVVLNGKPESPTRVILEFGFQSKEFIERKLTIRTQTGDYTDEYKNLTKDFHNKTL